jgi:hypothetical protein
MDPEIKESDYVNPPSPEFKVEAEASLADVDNSMANQSSEQAKQVWERVKTLLASLPDYLSDFFGEYKRPIVTLGLIFASIVSVKLTLALLDAINDIPLLAPTFELIGITYFVWFVYRYLWKAQSREELVRDFSTLKDEVLGGKRPPKL